MNKLFNESFGVYCCPHVFHGERPVLLAIRTEDGDWQFLCGKDDHDEKCHHVGVGHLIERDETISPLANLQKGEMAERNSLTDDWSVNDFEE